MNKYSNWEIIYKGKNSDIVKTLLKIRGIVEKKDINEFLNPTHPQEVSLKEFGLEEKNISKVIKRIKTAIKNNEELIVYGDYDADGICGTAILWESLYALGAKVMPYIPDRFTEGYGLNIEAIKKLKKSNPKLTLIFTVDHGIVAVGKVDYATNIGIDVVITDHHVIGKTLPKAYSVIHTTKLSGAGVAWVLAREIRKRFKFKDTDLKNGIGLDLASIGTIADQLPFTGVNRSIIKFGLADLNKTTRPGLNAMFDEAACRKGKIGPYEVGFLLAPRVNATGRLSHAIESLRLLCTKNKIQAAQLALHLGKVNKERQRIVDEVVEHALIQADKLKNKGIVIVAGKDYHEGVIGLAASKLAEKYYRPAIVISKGKSVSKASARSIPGFNIIEAIRKLEGLYLEGGGHPMAAGFSIETVKIKEFTAKINRISAKDLTGEILTKKLKVDLEFDFDNLNRATFNLISKMDPFGLGNPTPLFLTKDVSVCSVRAVGRENLHLKLTLKKDSKTLGAVAFGFGEDLPKIVPNGGYDFIYNLSENNFNGNSSIELKIKDFRKVEK